MRGYIAVLAVFSAVVCASLILFVYSSFHMSHSEPVIYIKEYMYVNGRLVDDPATANIAYIIGWVLNMSTPVAMTGQPIVATRNGSTYYTPSPAAVFVCNTTAPSDPFTFTIPGYSQCIQLNTILSVANLTGDKMRVSVIANASISQGYSIRSVYVASRLVSLLPQPRVVYILLSYANATLDVPPNGTVAINYTIIIPTKIGDIDVSNLAKLLAYMLGAAYKQNGTLVQPTAEPLNTTTLFGVTQNTRIFSKIDVSTGIAGGRAEIDNNTYIIELYTANNVPPYLVNSSTTIRVCSIEYSNVATGATSQYCWITIPVNTTSTKLYTLDKILVVIGG